MQRQRTNEPAQEAHQVAQSLLGLGVGMVGVGVGLSLFHLVP